MMKRKLIAVLSIFLSLTSFLLPCKAADTGYSWYCRHVKGHLQPTVAPELAFVTELEGYFIDTTHTDPTAADRVIYLTFDAGYENGNVARVLDVLKEEGVPAAFFILGNLIRNNTDLVIRMGEEGHLICNHTVRHRDMSRADDEALLEELRELEGLCKSCTSFEMAKYYRPPEGRFSRKNLECTAKNGYKTIFWSFAYPDWDNAAQPDLARAKEIILENVHNGEVMLLHPTSATNAAILGDVIRTLKAQGYRFGTLDELTRGQG